MSKWKIRLSKSGKWGIYYSAEYQSATITFKKCDCPDCEGKHPTMNIEVRIREQCVAGGFLFKDQALALANQWGVPL